jgi:TonB family protein
VRTDGKVVGDLAGTDVRLQSGPADLRLERRGKDLLALVRQGDEAWREAGRAQVDLPRTVAVGVTAVNTARSPFRAGFTRFDLLREPGTALPLDASSPASPAPAGDAAPGLADSDSAPKPLRMTKPLYPQEAFQKKIQGTVLVEILIDSAGRVACSRILESVPGLDEAALDCIRGWQFTPARKGGQAVPTIAHVPVVFRIGSGPAPPPP